MFIIGAVLLIVVCTAFPPIFFVLLSFIAFALMSNND